MTSPILPYLLVEFSFVVLDSPVLYVLFGPVSVSFLFSFFRQYFLISSSFRFSCRAFAVSSENFFLAVFSIFACRSFLICDSNLSSHPGFDFLSVVFRKTPIFSQTNFGVSSCIKCHGYCIRGLLYLPIYLLVDFQYCKVRKPTILRYCANRVSEPLFLLS